MRNEADIIIIGAGVCGLSIAEALLSKGKSVLLLEARNRVGGRLHACKGNFSKPVEAGAEFIHGKLPLTLELLKKASGHFYEKEGEFYKSKEGKIFRVEEFIPYMDELMKEVAKLKADISLSEFLRTHFTDKKYDEFRTSVIRLAEGFDAADPEKISMFALQEEWAGESFEVAYGVKEGYTVITEYLKDRCNSYGESIHLSKEVKQVEWQNEKVKVMCGDESVYSASRLIVTASLGVLTSEKGEQGHISFFPSLSGEFSAAKEMGFGPVIKAVFEFKNKFWNNDAFNKDAPQISDLGFLMNESKFPMFWTNDGPTPIMTGWVGGSAADKLKHHSDEELKNLALKALAEALLCTELFLNSQLITLAVFNWATDPFSKGAYAYATPKTVWAKKIIKTPVENTIFFAGEAFGKSMGTVEAALESADELVKIISKQDKT